MSSYILRFDDICPTMNWDVWREIEVVLNNLQIKPIVAVVPENLDPSLVTNTPRTSTTTFWEHVRKWQSSGWTIGLHGYQHLYATQSAGILGINKRSEFAGLSRDHQRKKLRSAIAVLSNEGVKADLFVAPAHSFDNCTLEELLTAGLSCVSDGFALYPYKDRLGVTWVPQQLWDFRSRPLGVWTICNHHNQWDKTDIARFHFCTTVYASKIIGVQDALRAHPPLPLRGIERSISHLYYPVMRTASAFKQRLRPQNACFARK